MKKLLTVLSMVAFLSSGAIFAGEADPRDPSEDVIYEGDVCFGNTEGFVLQGILTGAVCLLPRLAEVIRLGGCEGYNAEYGEGACVAESPSEPEGVAGR